MKRFAFALVVMLGVAGFAAAQVTSPTKDVLGAHNVYGRGCIACHAPHSGSAGNGGKPPPTAATLRCGARTCLRSMGKRWCLEGGAL